LSRSVLAHGSRQVASWLIFDVGQRKHEQSHMGLSGMRKVISSRLRGEDTSVRIVPPSVRIRALEDSHPQPEKEEGVASVLDSVS
jgi:hypothetical protein